MVRWIETTLQDARFAVRGWGRNPGFAIAAIATLALGMGANTAIFSVFSGVLLRPLPFPDSQSLVNLYEVYPSGVMRVQLESPVTSADFLEWRRQSKLLAGLASYSNSGRSLQNFGEPEQVPVLTAERSLFRLLGVSPLLGRTFREGDPLTVAVVSYAFWKNRFHGDRNALGRTILLDGQPYTLLGVMPDGFQFPYQVNPPQLWLPMEAPSRLNSRLDAVVARLRPGIALEAARQELTAMDAPSKAKRVVALHPLHEVVSASARQSLLILLGAVGMVLLVACVNVANLLLARTASRSREIAIRAALGAGRFRLIRQFLTESFLLSLCGGLAGLAIGEWGRRLLLILAAAQLPRSADIALDWRVFGFLLALCALTGAGFGLAPAFTAARGGSAALKNRGVRSVLRDGLVVVEIGLAFMLLAGAGLLLRTFLNLQRTNAGFQAENVLTVHVVVADGKESNAIADRVSRIPGVHAAGLISLLPLQESNWFAGFHITGRPEVLATELRFVTPGYFRAMGIPLRGREFTERDQPDRPMVILVNQALARQYFGGEDPVGRSTDRGTIIGVVGDVRQVSLREPAKPEIFYSVAQNFAQIRRQGSTLVVRGRMPAEALAGAIRAAVREVSPGQALFHMATMQEVVSESLATQRLYTWLISLFAGIGTLLAVAGVYGVIAYTVALRTREFGIRMAMGADTPRLVRLVVGRAALLVALGLVAGLAGAWALTRFLRGLLFGVHPMDPATFVSMAALLAMVGLAASFIPARRAALVDPSVALGSE